MWAEVTREGRELYPQVEAGIGAVQPLPVPGGDEWWEGEEGREMELVLNKEKFKDLKPELNCQYSCTISNTDIIIKTGPSLRNK